jgi:hypothetical protein
MIEDKIPQRSDRLTSLLLIEIHNLLIDVKDDVYDQLKLSEETKKTQIENNNSFLKVQIENQKLIAESIRIQSESFKENQKLLSTIERANQTNLTTIAKQLTYISRQMNNSIDQQKLILEQQTIATDQLLEEADEGRRIIKSGTATTTAFTTISTIDDPGHPIKAYRVTNNGPKTLYVGFNNAESRIGPDITDVLSDPDQAGFEKVSINATAKESFDRDKIRNIYILAVGGNCDYTAKLIW